MARKADNTQGTAYEYKTPSTHDKAEKPAGNTHTLTDFWFAPGYKAPLEAGSRFIECNDGWYTVYNSRGGRMCYRISARVIKTVFGAEATVAI